MCACGTKRTWPSRRTMSAFGGTADIPPAGGETGFTELKIVEAALDGHPVLADHQR
jgi:hypothetical protein